MKTKILPLLTVLGLSIPSAFGQQVPTPATPDAPTIAELQAQIQNLQSKVDKVDADQLKEQADRAAVIRQVISDADQQTALTSGYDPNVGFVIRSGDGAYSFHPGLVLDFRNMTNYRQSIPPRGGGETARTGYDTQNGFDLTRARLTFDGNFTKDINYFVQFSADQGAPLSLLDAYWTYRLSQTPFSIKVGQFKDPLFHERNLSEANLMAVDRSLVESLLGGGQTSRVQGASFIYDQDRIRAQAVIHDGYDSINTRFFDAGGNPAGVAGGAGVTPTNFGTSARAEYLAVGERNAHSTPFKSYDNGFSALGVNHDYLIVGGGYDYSQAGDNNILFHTADVQYDTATGLSLYAAYLGTYRNLHGSQGVTPGSPVTPPGNFYDPGALLQAAYLLTPKIEPFVRYDYTYLDGASVAGFGLNKNEVQEATIGANYYILKQHAKITVDASWLPEGAPTDSDALGVLKNSGENEFILRAQFQLAI